MPPPLIQAGKHQQEVWLSPGHGKQISCDLGEPGAAPQGALTLESGWEALLWVVS